MPVAARSKGPRWLGWNKINFGPEHFAEAKTRRHTGVGIKTKNTPAIDVDVRDADVVEEMLRFIREDIGDGPLRYGRAPKVLMLFKTDKPFRKLNSRKYVCPDGLEHKVEVLGDGQQFAAYHIHPETLEPYRWDQGSLLFAEPAEMDREALSPLSLDQARRVIEKFEQIAEARGWQPAQRSQSSKNSASTYRDPEDTFLVEPTLPDVGLDEIQETLDQLDPAAMEYDQWLKCIAAVHHQTEGSPEGFEIADAWSSNDARYKPKDIKDRWRGFGKGGQRPVTFRALLAWVRDGEYAAAATEPTDFGVVEEDEKGGALWPEPDLSYGRDPDLNLPTFPREIFGATAILIEDAAASKSASPGFVANALLIAISSIIQNACDAHVRPGWFEPSVLWGMNVGLPSTNKSPAVDAIVRPLDKTAKDVNCNFDAAHSEWESENRVSEIHQKAWKKRAEEAAKKGEDVPVEPPEAIAPKEPERAVLRISECSPEKLIARKKAQKEGLLLTVDELGTLLVHLGRLDQLARRSVIVESYGARAFELDQIKTGKGTLSVSRLALSILGNTQPDRLTEVLSQVDDGLLSRFDIVWSDQEPPLRYDGQGTDEVVQAALRRLFDLAARASEPKTIHVAAEAQELFHECRQQMRDLSRDQSPIVQGWLGKAPGKIIRYALNLAHLDYAFGHSGEPEELNAEHIARARMYVFNYLLPMYCYAIGEASLPLDEKRARVLFRLIQNNSDFAQGQIFTARDIRHRNRTSLGSTKDIEEALKMLVQANVVREERVPNSGRKTAKRYSANPRMREAVAGND